jgi:hypothetical protein
LFWTVVLVASNTLIHSYFNILDMKSAIVLLGAAAGVAMANPGMGYLMRNLAKRQAAPNQTLPLIGDLVTVGAVTPVGKLVEGCLQDASGASCEVATPKTYVAPGELGSTACAKDTCCVWNYVAADLVELYTNENGTCNDYARAAVRLGFHDACAWSLTTGPGGADGSLVLGADEINRPENNGLQTIRTTAQGFLTKYGRYGVGAADLVQFMHNVAVVTCPLGPRQITLIGRDSSNLLPPEGLLPSTTSPVTDLLNLFVNKTIGTIDIISLIGAHTTATQRFVDPTAPGPLDTTNGIWDVIFYAEVLAPVTPPGTFRLPSDNAFSLDNRTDHGFTVFSDPATGQQVWNAFYSRAYLRLSLLGVDKINELTDCTEVLPNAQPVFSLKQIAPSNSASVVNFPTTSAYYAPTQTVYTTSTIYGPSSWAYTEKGVTKWSTTLAPISTTVCPIDQVKTTTTPSPSPVYNYPKSSSSVPYPVKVTSSPVAYGHGTAAGTGTGAYKTPVAAQFTGAANKNSFGLAALAGAAAVALF